MGVGVPGSNRGAFGVRLSGAPSSHTRGVNRPGLEAEMTIRGLSTALPLVRRTGGALLETQRPAFLWGDDKEETIEELGE